MLRITTYGVLFILIPLIIAIDFLLWILTPASTAQGILSLIAGVGFFAPVIVEDVYTNCWRQQNGGQGFIFSFQCSKAVGRASAAFLIGAKGFGYSTGWYGLEEHGVNYVATTNADGTLLYHIDLTHPLSKRIDDDDTNMTTFSFENITLAMPTDLAGKYLSDFVGVAFSEHNDTHAMPVHVVRYSKNAGMRIDFILLEQDDGYNSDVVPLNGYSAGNYYKPGGYYTTGGSMVLACQYTLGHESGNQHVELFELAGKGSLLHSRMVAYYGYMGPTSKLKCDSKVYSYAETQDSWRVWDDVGSS